MEASLRVLSVAVELGGLGLRDCLVSDASEVEKGHLGDYGGLLSHIEVWIQKLRVCVLLNVSFKSSMMTSPCLVVAASTVVILLSNLRGIGSGSTTIPVVAASCTLSRSRVPIDTPDQVVSGQS